MKVESEFMLDYSDVLIRPKRSTLVSRSDVNLVRKFKFPHAKQTWTGVPIIASNMDTVGTIEMWKVLSKNKMLTCLHKFVKIEDVIKTHLDGEADIEYCMISTGITDKDYKILIERVEKVRKHKVGLKFVCIDVANGYMQRFVEFCKKVRLQFPEFILVAGNVVSREVVEELIINGGIDIVKVGIGSGSVCTTRLQTGVGMPQLSATLECSDAAHGVDGCIIADGGICVPGDVSKAFGAGADFVMCGSVFSGHDESSGEIITDKNGERFKVFYGMSSTSAMNKYHGGVAKYRSAEGKTVKVPYKGPVQYTLEDLLGGLRSTCTYVGARQLKHLPKCTTFMKVKNQVNTIYKSKHKLKVVQGSPKKQKLKSQKFLFENPQLYRKNSTFSQHSDTKQQLKVVNQGLSKINQKMEAAIEQLVKKSDSLDFSNSDLSDGVMTVIEAFYTGLDADASQQDTLVECFQQAQALLPELQKELKQKSFGFMVYLNRNMMLLKQKLRATSVKSQHKSSIEVDKEGLCRQLFDKQVESPEKSIESEKIQK